MNDAKLVITQEKHKHIYILYSLLLKKKGKDAKYMARMGLYEDVARFFYADKLTIGRIINNLQRNHYSPSQVDMDCFFEQMDDLLEIRGV